MNKIFWELHKKLYTDMYDELDSETKTLITNNPYCPEAIEFNLKVKEAVNMALTPPKENNTVES